MSNLPWKRFVSVVTILTLSLFALPVEAGCPSCCPDSCVGPCNYSELIVDTAFVYTCSEWNTSGTVYAGSTFMLMDIPSTLSQDLSIPTGYSLHNVGFNVTPIVNASPGTERLRLTIVRQSDGATLEVIAIFNPSSTGGYNSYAIGDYTGQNVRIVATVTEGLHPGDSEFQVNGVWWWETV